MEQEKFIEQEPTPKFEALEKLFGENFNPEKTIKLEKDLDEDNELRELGNYESYWTEFRNPDSDEVVEGKVYLPKEGVAKDILIISPGYKGDFAMQEAKYADDFSQDGRAVIFLRHNGLRIEGEDVKNYIHCPEKQKEASEKKQKYIGNEEKFSWHKANREILTALKSLGNKIDDIGKIDIIGHSWGGSIAVNSMVELHRDASEAAKKIEQKIDNVILMGAMLETRSEVFENYREFFESEAGKDYFKGMDAEAVINDLISDGEAIGKMTAKDLPLNVRLVGVESVADADIDLQGETLPFFTRMKELNRKGNIVFKDLKEFDMPEKIGGRDTEVHDYPLDRVRRWIAKIIERK
ncbi:MAG: alpha/beta hydrolase [Patescibacteria group bacterium]|nr:alpha/beta hydrolase [Patescibacteria group bacterium]